MTPPQMIQMEARLLASIDKLEVSISVLTIRIQNLEEVVAFVRNCAILTRNSRQT